MNESKLANDKNLWNFYEPASKEYSQGFRIWLNFEADVTHVEFEHSKGDYFVTVCPDHAKKNEVVSIHRISKAAT